jgi:DNA-binding transcriptional regulator PaaX
MTSKRAKGLNPHNKVARDATRSLQSKIRTTISLNDEWRKLCEEDPMLPYKISFPEWRKEKMRKRYHRGSAK